MTRDGEVNRIKRLSRKHVPRRRERVIPPRKRDTKKDRHSAREYILQAIEEEDDFAEDEKVSDDESVAQESEESTENKPRR